MPLPTFQLNLLPQYSWRGGAGRGLRAYGVVGYHVGFLIRRHGFESCYAHFLWYCFFSLRSDLFPLPGIVQPELRNCSELSRWVSFEFGEDSSGYSCNCSSDGQPDIQA